MKTSICLDCGSEFLRTGRIVFYCKKCFGIKIMRSKGNDVGFKKCPMCKLCLPIAKFGPDKKCRCRAYCLDCEKLISKDRKNYMNEYTRNWKKTEKGKASRHAYRKRLREELAPSYLKKLAARYLPIKESEIPQEALEIKRAVVELKRALK